MKVLGPYIFLIRYLKGRNFRGI